MRLHPREFMFKRPIVSAAIFVAISLIITSCSFNSGSDLSYDAWVASTEDAIRQPVQSRNGIAEISIFSTQHVDTYQTALAIVASALSDGPSKRAVAVASERIVEAFRTGQFAESSGGNLYTLAEIAQANHFVPFLTRDTVDELGRQFEQARLSLDPGQLDSIDAYMLMRTAVTLGQVDPGLAATVQQIVRLSNSRCPGEADAVTFLYSLSIPGIVDPPCSGSSTVIEEWDGLAITVGAMLDGRNDLDGYDCEMLRALTEAREEQWPGDRVRAEVVHALVEKAASRLRQNELGDPLTCLSDIQIVFRLADNRPYSLTDEQSEYVNWLLKGGGAPISYPVDELALEALLTIARLTGSPRPNDDDVSALSSDSGLLVALVATDSGWEKADRRYLDNLLASKTELPSALNHLIGLLRISGKEGCSWLDANDRQMELRALANHPKTSPVQLARILSIQELCGENHSRELRSTQVRIAKAQLADLATATVGSMWKASSVLCALEPDAILPGDFLWATLAKFVDPMGGVATGFGQISLIETSQLMELVQATPTNCRARGLLGFPKENG